MPGLPSIPQQVPENIPTKITITIPTHAYFLSGIRDFTLEMVKNLTGFSEQWAFRFQSIIDELCNNAIEHGSSAGKDIKITFRCQKNEYMEIFVEDTGTGSQKLKPEELKKKVEEAKQADPTNLTSLRGRGLPHIVANWTDLLEFRDSEQGGLCVHVVKYLRADVPSSQAIPSAFNTSGQVYQL